MSLFFNLLIHILTHVIQAEDIKSKLTISHVRPNPCENEQNVLIQCLKPKGVDSNNRTNNDDKSVLVMDCTEAVNAYVACAASSAIQ